MVSNRLSVKPFSENKTEQGCAGQEERDLITDKIGVVLEDITQAAVTQEHPSQIGPGGPIHALAIDQQSDQSKSQEQYLQGIAGIILIIPGEDHPVGRITVVGLFAG